jgi:putative beta-lysine N-acetyltransferase
MSKFLSEKRMQSITSEENSRIIADFQRRHFSKAGESIPDEYHFTILDESSVPEMIKIYKQVFTTYPFPIHDPVYIKKTMCEDVIYFGIYKDNSIVSLSSALIDLNSKNVEMSDFATLPGERRKGLATYLLQMMEEKVREMGMITAYTIARASSPGINAPFLKMEYIHGGVLVNNTNIAGSIEDMNTWYKKL